MRLLLAAILFFPLLSDAGDATGTPGQPSKLQQYFDAYTKADDGQVESADDINAFIGRLEQKQTSFRDTRAFVSYIFDKTHRRFLRSYTDYVSFGKTVTTGAYNCLTGTALYALLLDRFKIDYEIIETNYHIFLLVHTDKGDVLLEATDPENGCVTDSEKIKERIARYKQNEIANRDNSKRYFQYNTELYKEVSLDEMTGLLYYNLAIVSYNNKELAKSVEQLQQAIAYYESPRIVEFSRLLLLTIVDSELEEHLKERCIKDLQAIRANSTHLTARIGQ